VNASRNHRFVRFAHPESRSLDAWGWADTEQGDDGAATTARVRPGAARL